MNRIFFINVNTLKQLSEVEFNVDEKIISNTIYNCQKQYSIEILGSNLYKEIEYQISANTVSDLNKTLLNDYVIPSLIKRVEANLIISSAYKFTNTNFIEKTAENSELVSLSDKFSLKEYYDNQAELFEQRTIKYLCANSSLYPNYKSNSFDADDIRPSSDTYFSGIQ